MTSLPISTGAAQARGPEPSRDAQLAVGREPDRQRDEAEGGEDDAHVADDVVVAGRHTRELGIRGLTEDAREHEDGDGREADEADRHRSAPA